MLLFAKIAVAVVASLTSLMGIWQTANVILELQPYLTLPNTRTYLILLRLGLRNSLFQSTAEAPASLVRANDPLCPPFDIPPMLWAQSCSSQDEFLWVNADPDFDQHIASNDQLIIEKPDYLNTILDYIFSFVEKRPTSAMEVLTFSLVAVLVVACVLFAGTSVYWCLRFIDLRGHQALTTTASLPNVADITLPDPTIECDDALPILLDPVPPEPESNPEPDEKALFVQNVVDTMTKLVIDGYKSDCERLSQQHDKLEEKLDPEITKMIEENKSEVERVFKQYNQSESTLRAEFKDAIKASNNYISKMRKDLGSDVRSKHDSFAFKFDAKLDSKANDDSLLRLETKLGKDIAVVKFEAQSKLESAISQSNKVRAEALTKVGTSVSGHDAAISEVLKELKALKSSFKMLEEGSTQQHQESFILKQRLKKSDIICEDLKAKLNNVELDFQAKLGKLEARLKPTINNLGSKTQEIEVTIGKQQTDLKKIQAEIESQAANVSTAKNLANSKVDAKDFNELEKKFSGCVETHQLNNLSEEIAKVSSLVASKASTSALENVCGAIEGKLAKVGGEVVSVQEALGSKAEQVVKVERDVMSVQQALASKVEQIAKVDRDVMSIQKVLTGKAEQISKVEKDIASIERALAGKVDGSEVESLKLQVASKVDATEWAAADKGAKEGLLDLSANVQARLGSLESQYADKAAQLAQDSAKTSVVPDLPVESVHQPADGRPIANDRQSNFHVPTLKVDPMAAARGEDALSQSIWAPREPQSSADITNPPIPTTPETSEAASPSNTLSEPEDAQTREILQHEQAVDGSSKPVVVIPQVRLSPASTDVRASIRGPQNAQHADSATGLKPRSPIPQVQSVPLPNGLGASRWGDGNVQPLDRSIDRQPISPVRNFQMVSPSSGIEPPYGTPRNGQPLGSLTDSKTPSRSMAVSQGTYQNCQSPGSLTELKSTSLAPGGPSTPSSMSMSTPASRSTSAGLGASQWAPKNGQQPGPSVDLRSKLPHISGKANEAKKSSSLTDSQWAKAPLFSPSPGTTSTLLTPPTSRAFPAHNQVMSQQDQSNGEPVSSFPGPGYSAKQLALQNPLLTVRQRMGTSSSTPLPPTHSLADLETEIAANPNSPGSLALIHSHSSPASPSVTASLRTPSPMDVSRSNHLTVGMAQIPTQPKAMTHLMANPVTSSEAKLQNNPERGPGPNGGKVVLTQNKILHNRRQRTQWKIKKTLSRFSLQQQQHAWYYQDRKTLLFQSGCPWDWLNSLVTNQARDYWVEPPIGWVAPTGPPPGLLDLPDLVDCSESPSDTDEFAEL